MLEHRQNGINDCGEEECLEIRTSVNERHVSNMMHVPFLGRGTFGSG